MRLHNLPRPFKILNIALLVVLCVFVFGFVVEHVWNWLMPAVFGLRTITFLQAVALIFLGKVLFGGFHRHGGHCGGGRHWRDKMEARFATMTPEERERFRAGMRGRCGFPPSEPNTPTSV
jgi:hypothetical protein